MPHPPVYLIVKHYEPEGEYQASLAPLSYKGRNLTPNVNGVIVEKRRLKKAEFEEVCSREHIRSVEEDPVGSGSGTPTLIAARTFHDVTPLHQRGVMGQGQVIAMLDGGLDATHATRVSSRIIASANFIGTSGTVDTFGHGTWTTGCAMEGAPNSGAWRAGQGQRDIRSGYAPRAKFLIGQVLDSSNHAVGSSVIDGMNWAVLNGASVVNMSLLFDNSSTTSAICLVVNAAYQNHGLLSCCAAGNNQNITSPTDRTTAMNADIASPANADEAISVGSVTDSSTLSTFSNWGNTLDILAIGDAAYSWGLSGTWLQFGSGTSMATSAISGSCAMLLSAGFSPARVRTALKAAARSINLPSYEQGAGIVDAYASLRYG